jgi:para-aminobenzoate synthetase/4-amino-4-deoxychorismate lyase
MAAVPGLWPPDPEQGIFETLLVIDGRPVELDAHEARLNASLAKLFPGLPIPPLDEIDLPAQRGSLRIEVKPVGNELAIQTSVRTGKHRSRPVALHSLCVPAGLGAHKWADRRLLAEAQSGLPGDALPLIVDEDGSVLEASRANVFVVRGGALVTPPLDGRILPGITRRRVMELAADVGLSTEEAALCQEDILAADEVFVSGSVRGIEPVASLDGAELPSGRPITAKLATELRRAWLGAPAT